MPDNVSGTVCLPGGAFNDIDIPLRQCWRFPRQLQRRATVADQCSQWLVQFVGHTGRHLTHGANAHHMCRFQQHALRLFLGVFTLGDVAAFGDDHHGLALLVQNRLQ